MPVNHLKIDIDHEVELPPLGQSEQVPNKNKDSMIGDANQERYKKFMNQAQIKRKAIVIGTVKKDLKNHVK